MNAIATTGTGTYDLWHTSPRYLVGYAADVIEAHGRLRRLGAGYHLTGPDGTVLAVRVDAERLAFVPYPEARFMAPAAFGLTRKRTSSTPRPSPFERVDESSRVPWRCGWSGMLAGAWRDAHPKEVG